MTKPRTPRHRFASRIRFLPVLVAGVLAAGCLLPIDNDAKWQLTFQGRVVRIGTTVPVAGARVEIWLDPPVGNAPPFVQGESNARGEYELTRSYRSPGVSPTVLVRYTPPANSGLEGGTFTGHVSDLFDVEYANQAYTYTADWGLGPASP